MKIIDNDSVYIESYDSLAEAVRHAEKVSDKNKSSHKHAYDWNGNVTFNESVDLALKGWHEVRPQVDRMFNELESSISDSIDQSYTMVYDYSGDMVDMGRYMAGDPECMIDYVAVPQERMGRVINVLVNMSASAMVDPDTMLKRGVAVTALLDAMHKLGVGLSVWCEMPTARMGVDKGDVYSQLVKLHDSSDNLDIDNLMYAICHPSMLRRLGFGLHEGSAWKHAKHCTSGGYGYPANVKCEKLVGADVVIGMTQDANGSWQTNPVAWVVNTIRGLGLID